MHMYEMPPPKKQKLLKNKNKKSHKEGVFA